MDTLTVCDAAKMLGISELTLRKRISRGTLPCVREGGRIRIRLADLTSGASQQSTPSQGPTIQDAAEALGLRQLRVRQMMYAGRLRSVGRGDHQTHILDAEDLRAELAMRKAAYARGSAAEVLRAAWAEFNRAAPPKPASGPWREAGPGEGL